MITENYNSYTFTCKQESVGTQSVIYGYKNKIINCQ